MDRLAISSLFLERFDQRHDCPRPATFPAVDLLPKNLFRAFSLVEGQITTEVRAFRAPPTRLRKTKLGNMLFPRRPPIYELYFLRTSAALNAPRARPSFEWNMMTVTPISEVGAYTGVEKPEP